MFERMESRLANETCQASMCSHLVATDLGHGNPDGAQLLLGNSGNKHPGKLLPAFPWSLVCPLGSHQIKHRRGFFSAGTSLD